MQRVTAMFYIGNKSEIVNLIVKTIMQMFNSNCFARDNCFQTVQMKRGMTQTHKVKLFINVRLLCARF
jgi:hypothetical protein